MGIGTHHHAGVKHAGQFNVAAVFPLTCGFVIGIAANDAALADPFRSAVSLPNQY
jgi:hypothetical protein